MFRAAILLLATSIGLFAGVISPNQWYGFSWNGSLPSATSGQQTSSSDATIVSPGPGPWTITLSGPGQFVVVDGFTSGDQFQVFDFGVSIGTSSSVSNQFTGCAGGDGPIACLADPHFSSGSFAVGAGSHSFTISTIAGIAGGAWFEVTGASVPEPSTLSFVALAGIALAMRRRIR